MTVVDEVGCSEGQKRGGRMKQKTRDELNDETSLKFQQGCRTTTDRGRFAGLQYTQVPGDGEIWRKRIGRFGPSKPGRKKEACRI